jgi:hypothetical protein
MSAEKDALDLLAGAEKEARELQEAAHQKADAVERDFGQRHEMLNRGPDAPSREGSTCSRVSVTGLPSSTTRSWSPGRRRLRMRALMEARPGSRTSPASTRWTGPCGPDARP